MQRLGPGALLVVSILAACGRSGAPQPSLESLLLVTVDTLRADHVGAYGGPVPTPAMDELAREGVLVEGACTPTPSTGPAHVSLLTGLYPWKHGVLANAVPFDAADLPNLAALADDAGLATAAFVSSYVLHRRWGFARGFDTFHFAPTHPFLREGRLVPFWSRAERATDAALSWLESHRSERFFVWVHYFDPHDPYQPPRGYARPRDEPVDLEGKSLPPGIRSRAQLANLNRRYRGEIAYTDAHVGRLLEGLRRLGLYERTAVILTSDHGEGMGDHGLLGHGQNLFDELVLVPLLIRAPNIEGGRRLVGPAQLEDLMPTALSLLGLAVPDGLDGYDLLPWLRGDTDRSPRDAVLGQRAPFPDKPGLYFERAWPRKWIGELPKGGETFRLDDDPREVRGTRSTQVPAALREATGGEASTGRPQVLDEESRRALEALGYLEE